MTGDVKSPRDQVSYLDSEIFKQKMSAWVKCNGTLDSNLQMCYSLLLGQCTELLNNQLKSSTRWDTIMANQDVMGLIAEIQTIMYRFEDLYITSRNAATSKWVHITEPKIHVRVRKYKGRVRLLAYE